MRPALLGTALRCLPLRLAVACTIEPPAGSTDRVVDRGLRALERTGDPDPRS